MIMKTILGLVLIVLHANITPVQGAKSELTSEEQKKLLDTLDHDRKEIAHQLKIPYEDIKYALNQGFTARNQELCKKIIPGESSESMPLKWNDVMDDLLKAMGPKLSEHFSELSGKTISFDLIQAVDMSFFNPKLTKIGCSKTIKCSQKLPENFDFPEVAGKTIETQGMCVLNTNLIDPESYDKLSNVELPSISKYAEIVGVGAIEKPVKPGNVSVSAELSAPTDIVSGSTEAVSSSGKAFNMILFALFLIFCEYLK